MKLTQAKRKRSYYVAVFLSAILSLVFLSYQYVFAPYGNGGYFYVEKGTSLRSIAKQLKNQGFIRSEWSVLFLAKLNKGNIKIIYGEYEFKPSMKAIEVFNKIKNGEINYQELVIPEGLNYQEIAKKLISLNIGTEQDYDALFTNTELRQKISPNIINLEGYLFPAKYRFDHHSKPQQMISAMLDQFNQKFDSSMRNRASELGMSLEQLVTLASIVEKETAAPSDRAKIAGVFINRLKINMPLASDPTVIYGIKNFNGNLTRADLKNPHPYNTYIHPGLPPSPIAGPGLASIKAVLYPEQHDYLFFVAKGDGTSYFSKDYTEHLAAIAKYQLGNKQ